jgi:hypothetical protein
MTRITILCFIMLLASFKVLALDSEITILAVYTPTTATKSKKMTDAMGYANTVWNNLSISAPLKFANNGLPVALSSSLGGSNAHMSTQIAQAYSTAQISSLRNDYKADIV